MRYIAFLHEDAEPGVGISFPDFPGCVSQADTVDHAVAKAAKALSFHAGGMMEDGETLPAPRPLSEVIADPDLSDWREGAAIAYVPLIIDRGSPKRVNVSFDPGLLAEIDAEAEARGTTRSAFLASAARKELIG